MATIYLPFGSSRKRITLVSHSTFWIGKIQRLVCWTLAKGKCKKSNLIESYSLQKHNMLYICNILFLLKMLLISLKSENIVNWVGSCLEKKVKYANRKWVNDIMDESPKKNTNSQFVCEKR